MDRTPGRGLEVISCWWEGRWPPWRVVLAPSLPVPRGSSVRKPRLPPCDFSALPPRAHPLPRTLSKWLSDGRGSSLALGEVSSPAASVVLRPPLKLRALVQCCRFSCLHLRSPSRKAGGPRAGRCSEEGVSAYPAASGSGCSEASWEWPDTGRSSLSCCTSLSSPPPIPVSVPASLPQPVAVSIPASPAHSHFLCPEGLWLPAGRGFAAAQGAGSLCSRGRRRASPPTRCLVHSSHWAALALLCVCAGYTDLLALRPSACGHRSLVPGLMLPTLPGPGSVRVSTGFASPAHARGMRDTGCGTRDAGAGLPCPPRQGEQSGGAVSLSALKTIPAKPTSTFSVIFCFTFDTSIFRRKLNSCMF